jgi:predicted HTH domain antitoxin
MINVTVQLPESIFSSLRKNPDEFIQEMRIASAVKWYEMGEILQNKASEIAGSNRSEFINALSRYRVDFMQYTAEELAQEILHVD